MSTKKSFHSLLLALIMVFLMVPATVVTAHAAGTCGDNLTWTMDDEGTLTISGTGNMYDYEYESGAPWMGEIVEQAVVGPGVTSIGAYAFSGCPNLYSAELADSITEIGSHAFYQVYNLWDIDFNFPTGLVKIGDWAFSGTHLVHVDLPVGLEEIGSQVFNASAVETITIPNTVTTLADGAFQGCHELTSINIPEGITRLDGTFTFCEKLTDVTLPSTLTEIGQQTFVNCAIESLRIPAGVASIGRFAFTNCASLASVYFCGDAPSFGENAFYMTTTTAYYPAGNNTWTASVRQNYGGTLTWVPYASFDITSQPTDFTGPIGATASFTVEAAGEGLTYQWQYKSLKDGRWYDTKADGYNTPTMRIGVTAARNGMQFRCKVTNSSGETVTSNAATLYAEAAGPAITSQPADFTGPIGATASFTVEAAGEGLTYQWQYKSLKDGKWYNANVDGCHTPTMSIGVTNSRNGMKFRCKVTGSGITVISNAATLHVGTVLAITSQPADFTGPIGATASFTVEAAGEGLTYQWQYKSLKNGKWYNANVDGFNTPTMSIGVTGNRDGMQFRCRITDDSNHHVISNAATLRAVTVGPDTVDYGTCGDNLTWTLDENGLLTISGTGDPWSYPFPDGAHLFQDHWEDLHEVVIEPGMTSISESMFEGLYIEHISIPDTVTRIEKKAFSDCTELKECVIPEGVTVIQEWTFRMCHSLETVVIPSTVTSIGGNAFNGCRALTGLILPEGLTAIGDYSFAGCLAFETLTIPSTVTSIGSNAFAYSFDTYYTPEKKPVITFLGNAPAIGDNAFQFVTGTVYYPASDPTWTETVCQNYGGTLTWIMYEPFAITSQPADFTGPIGATASFTVEATGEGLTYQWQYKSLKDGKWYNANVDGSNTPTMHIGVTGNRDGMQFRCRITDASGSHLISDAATLRVG